MELEVRIREKTGKGSSKKLRKIGWIPAVVYGANEENLHISVPLNEIHELVKETHGEAKVIKLKTKDLEKDVLLKHVDRDPVTGEIIHVDFQVVHKGEEIQVELPVEILGTARGTKVGGILEVLHWHIPVRGAVTRIPPHITIDVSNLDIHGSIHVKDLEIEGIKILLNPEEPIVTVLPPKRVEEVKAEAPAEEAAEVESEEEKEKEEEK